MVHNNRENPHQMRGSGTVNKCVSKRHKCVNLIKEKCHFVKGRVVCGENAAMYCKKIVSL